MIGAYCMIFINFLYYQNFLLNGSLSTPLTVLAVVLYHQVNKIPSAGARCWEKYPTLCGLMEMIMTGLVGMVTYCN